MENSLGKENITRFLSQISLSYKDVIKFCNDSYESRGIHLQLSEQSPFKYYPLLKIDDKYWCYYPRLFSYFIVHAFYDLMKKADPGGFSSWFGGVMEKYIEKNITKLKIDFIPERKLKNILGLNDPKVDFVINFSNFNILVESKAVELAPLAIVNPDPVVFENALEDSVTKAIMQTLFIRDKIEKREISGINSDVSYIFIVSYKELFLGHGQGAWEEIFKDATREFCNSRNIDQTKIDPSKIFFMSIADFDAFLRIISNKSADEIKFT